MNTKYIILQIQPYQECEANFKSTLNGDLEQEWEAKKQNENKNKQKKPPAKQTDKQIKRHK